MLEEIMGGEEASRECPNCHSKRNWKRGTRETKFGSVQRFICRDCDRSFSEKSYKEYRLSENSQLCAILEAKKLGTATEINTVAGEASQNVKGELIQFILYMQKEGLAKSTIISFNQAMCRLSKISNLNDPESVKEALSKLPIQENTKVTYCVSYTTFLRFLGKTWSMPKYTYHQKLPEFIPTEDEIDQLIGGVGKKIAVLLQLQKETGMRLGECLSLPWTCVNFQNSVVTLTVAEKNSLPRVFKASSKLLSMISMLPKQNERVFGKTSRGSATVCLLKSRKRIALKVGNPRIGKIHFHLIRHWKGTMEYHKTHDMDYVRRILGHRSIMTTQIYVNMEQMLFSNIGDEYSVKVASTIEEALKLVEVGFEYVTEMEGKKLFRKRK